MNRLVQGTIAAGIAMLANSGASWALECSATAVPVVFSSVNSSSTSLTESGSGAIDVNCDGGTGNETVYICLTLGAGGGSGMGNARYLSSTAPPSYSLFVNGRTALTVDVSVPIGTVTLSDGSGSASYLISGTIDWTGHSGGFSSQSYTFTGSEFVMTFGGDDACAETVGISNVSNFSVSGSIYPACTVDATALNFDMLGASIVSAVDQVASVHVNCPVTTSYTVTLGDGLWPGNGPFIGRAMKNVSANAFITYELFKDEARNQAWTGIGGTGTGFTESIPVYGRIPAPQIGLVAGAYSDTIVVTVTYDQPD